MRSRGPYRVVVIHVAVNSVFLSTSIPLPTTAQAMRALPSSVLDLHLDRYHLSHAGSKRMRAQRLWEHTHPDDTTGSDNTTQQESEDDGGSTTSDSPATSTAGSSGTEDNSMLYESTVESFMSFSIVGS